jgi:hypothetical protein
MRLKTYELIERIVEDGTEAGYNRAHKHTNCPIEETIKQCIAQYIMQGFDEYFEFANEDMSISSLHKEIN